MLYKNFLKNYRNFNIYKRVSRRIPYKLENYLKEKYIIENYILLENTCKNLNFYIRNLLLLHSV